MNSHSRNAGASWPFGARSREVRALCCAVLLLTAACSNTNHDDAPTGSVTECSSEWWRPCKHFSAEEFKRHVEQEQQEAELQRKHALATARGLDIDYQKCAVAVLVAEIGKQEAGAKQHIYISIIGEDPAPSVLSSLAAMGIKAEPGSRRPPVDRDDGVIVLNADNSKFDVWGIHPRWFGGYRATAGYHCGTLCAGSTEYRLKKSGDSCVVESQRRLWVS